MRDRGDDRIFSKSPRRRRRWPWVVLATAALLALVAALIWWVWVPRFRPGLNPGESYGVDVSNHQGDIDWDKVADDGMSFAYIKSTEGGDFVDVFFQDNWRGARASGLDVGAYHFFTLCRSGAEQAANFLSMVPVGEAQLPPALDLELAGNCSERPSQEWVDTEVGAFLDIVEEASGQPVLLYVGDKWEDRYASKATFDRSTWQLRPFRRPHGDQWTIWQVGGFFSVDGVDGPVDLNVMRPAVSDG